MKWLKDLKPWQRWGVVFGCVYLGLTVAVFLLLMALRIKGEGWGVFIVFLVPSFVIADFLRAESALINMFVFIFLILLNAVFYSAIGALAGATLGWIKRLSLDRSAI